MHVYCHKSDICYFYQDYIVKRLQQEDDQIAQVYIFRLRIYEFTELKSKLGQQVLYEVY